MFFGMEQSYQFTFWNGMDMGLEQNPSEIIMPSSVSDGNYVSEFSILLGKNKGLRREIVVN